MVGFVDQPFVVITFRRLVVSPTALMVAGPDAFPIPLPLITTGSSMSARIVFLIMELVFHLNISILA